MKKNKLILIGVVVLLLAAGLLTSAAIVQAQAPANLYPPDVGGLPGNRGSTITGFISQFIRNILLPIAGIIAVLFIIIGGFRYITAGGNDEQAEAGRKTLTNGVIGLIIIILSYAIITVVINALFLNV